MNSVILLAHLIVLVALANASRYEDRESEYDNDVPSGRFFRTARSKHVCPPLAMKKKDCNNCFCPKDGSKWLCTQMSCPEFVPAEAATSDGTIQRPDLSD